MPFLEREAKDPGAGDPMSLIGARSHPRRDSGPPPDGPLGAHVAARHREARGEPNVARRGAENVLRVAPQSGLVFRAVNADPPHHDEPGIRLTRVVEDLLEGFAVEKRLLDLDAPLARHPLADLA